VIIKPVIKNLHLLVRNADILPEWILFRWGGNLAKQKRRISTAFLIKTN